MLSDFRFVLLTLLLTQVNCQNPGKLHVVADMPSSLKEESGLATFDSKSVWVVEDSGNHDKIYKVDLEGYIVKEFEVKNAKDHDWEDLARDNKGHLYIGDFGNNFNIRKNLVIYKLPNPENEKGDKIDAEKIEFHYPEQKKFPPKKSKLYYDAESFFHWKNHLYIITKNRSRPFDGKSFVYKVPDKKGKHKAILVGEWVPCQDQDICEITSADISSDGKTIVALSKGLIWLITDFKFDDFTKGNIRKIDLGVRTQLESVCFLNDTTLLLTDEASHHEGGNLYRFDIEKDGH